MDPLSAAAPILRSVLKSTRELGRQTSEEVRGGKEEVEEVAGGRDVVGGWEESTTGYDASEANTPPRKTTLRKRALAFSACIVVLTCVILLAQIFSSLIIRLAEKDELWQSIYKYLKKRCNNDTMVMNDE